MSQKLNTLDVRQGDSRARFRDSIVDKNHGLRCILFKHINGHQHTIIDNDESDMVPFLQEITFDDKVVYKYKKQSQSVSISHSET